MSNELKRVTKTPKIVFMDTGLCAYLCKWDSAINLMNSSVSGHYLETFIISELIKNKRNSLEQLDYDIYYISLYLTNVELFRERLARESHHNYQSFRKH